jgi:hypothetical protein
VDQTAEASEALGGPAVSAPVTSILKTTRSGRAIKPVDRMNLADIESGEISAAELNYFSRLKELDHDELSMLNLAMNQHHGDSIDLSPDEIIEKLFDEFSLVGAGVGGGFDHTDELRVMNYRQAMGSGDAEEWTKAVKDEYQKFERFKVFKVVKRSELPAGAKVLSTTWAMKKKTNGKRRARLNARGYEQLEGSHFFADSISSPVSNPITIKTILTLLASNPDWKAKVIDIEGAFLQGEFTNGEQMYCDVPDGMERFYGARSDVVLLMQVPLYGTKQASNCFYKKLNKETTTKGYSRSKADPCLFFIRTSGELLIFVSWVDDLLAVGTPKSLELFEVDIKRSFEAKAEPEFNEYVGNRIEVKRGSDGIATIKFTQPVLIQKLKDNWANLLTGKPPRTPAIAGQDLSRDDGSGSPLSPQHTTRFRSGAAINMYMMQWSRPDIFNATRGLTRLMHSPNSAHEKALKHLIHYVISTENRGLVIKPNRVWDGSSEFEWNVESCADSNYASNVDDRRSVTGGDVTINGAPVSMRSATQRFVCLSVTESETAAGVTISQDMLYAYRILTSLGLKVKLPMTLWMDNKGAVDLANSWSVGGRTRHVDVRMHFLREMKDQGLLQIKHLPGSDNPADIFTKNTAAAIFERHVPKYCGTDEYIS